MEKGTVPWFIWPFAAVVRLLALIVTLVGRLTAAFIGLVLIVIGSVFVVSFVLMPLGIALFAVGFLLLIRSMF